MSVPAWTIELHSHTIYSKDCLIPISRVPAICQSKGIDKLAITDHNTAKAALELARLHRMLIIPGEEIMTSQGELLAWYITEEVPPGLSPEETIRRLRDQGALIGVPHPFDRYRQGAWRSEDLDAIVDQVDSIEVFNARCIHNEDNVKAYEFAQAHGKLMTCGSDAHIPYEYARAVVKARPFANSADGLRQALADSTRDEHLSGFWVHFASRYAKWAKRLVPSLNPV
jgi:predicted metal-dependent phosphoesterase TrpH